MTFQCEDIKTVVQLIELKDGSFTVDIKNGFHHIQIHESHRKCLGFFMEKALLCLVCIAFGLANSPDFCWNGNGLVKKSTEIQIVTVASPLGYGATCLGKQA